ncbi:hypothetical protein Tco_1215114 [Tanacetum coccineum]
MDWKSSKQSTTVMSSTKAEYIDASEATIEAIWIRKFIAGLESIATQLHPKSFHQYDIIMNKTPYELLHDNLPDLSFFYVFGALCYPTNDSENLDFDELTAMGSEHSSSGPTLHEMTPATISSGLVPNPSPSTPCSQDPRTNHRSPSLTIVDQDAPSPSNSQTTPETQSLVIPNDVEEDNHDLDVSHLNNDPFFGESGDAQCYTPMVGDNPNWMKDTSREIFKILHTIAKPTKKHLHAVKRIFKYLRGTVNRGLWYPKDSSIALTAYADADHAGCKIQDEVHLDV